MQNSFQPSDSVSVPRVKVCGVTRLADLDSLAAAGVDCVGINFVPTSPRCVSLSVATELAGEAAKLGLRSVGVFRNQPPDDIRQACGSAALDVIQLHGEESPRVLRELPALPIIKAISWSGRAEESRQAQAWLGAAQLLAFLVDAYAPVEGGGTGKLARWDLLSPRPSVFADTPLLLAGGLTPANVAEAIASVRPAGVDTASGVETAPGEKCVTLVRDFASNALKQFGEGGPVGG